MSRIPYAAEDSALYRLLHSDEEAEDYLAKNPGLSAILGERASVDSKPFAAVEPSATAIPAQWRDLLRLHYFIRTRRVTTVLEFGVGFSTAVMAHAVHLNSRDHSETVRRDLRRANAFEVHSVDESGKWFAVAASRADADTRQHIAFLQSEVLMTTFAGRICTEYERLPNICPDFIYMDAPAQTPVRGHQSGITTDHPDRLPMSCDLLKIEHFLLPGTLVVVDGRSANARFLKCNFQREWAYLHDPVEDFHLFELLEMPLGRWNERQINFSLGQDWLDYCATQDRTLARDVRR